MVHPTAGDKFNVFEDEREAKQIAAKRRNYNASNRLEHKNILHLQKLVVVLL
jgi:hypothetical protein